MKRVNFFWGIVAIAYLSLVFPSCNQFENFTNFTINYEQEAKVESSIGINLPFNIATPEMETNSEEEFINEDTKKEFVRSIFLETLTLKLFDPANEDFSFLEEISIFIKAEGLPEIEIASKAPVPESTSDLLDLDCTEEDLQEYIKSDRFTLRLNVVTDEILARDHYFKIKSSYAVSAQLND